MDERCGDSPSVEDEQAAAEQARNDRVEACYQGWGARDLAERVVDLEDELGADVDGVCTGMHADVAEAHAEVERLTRALRISEAKVGGAALYLREVNARMAMLEAAVATLDGFIGERDRYRLAWLSARRRAADEANHALEALELLRERLARFQAFADEVRSVRGWCMDGDVYRSHLTPIYEALYEVEDAERVGRPFVVHVQRDRT
ncbi:hypothetical protein [Streptomyces tsukubensis]|uniref:hypothetical protein n=1 Tax=Streptomyces tsukubensis TaxID=83656 RepID=UPI00344E3228